MNRVGHATRMLGSTGVELPVIGLGGAALMFGGNKGKGDERVAAAAGSPAGFRYPSDQEAHDTLRATYDLGIKYFDTAPWYGRGQSEHRIGRFLYDQQPRDDFILSTKVGRLLKRPLDVNKTPENPGPNPPAFEPLAGWADGGMGGARGLGLEFDHVFDYSYDGIMRGYEDSLQRLGMNRIDCLVIHDLDLGHFNAHQIEHHLAQLTTGGWRALETLKCQGEIKAYGAGVNHIGTMSQYLDIMELDFFLVSQIYSLMHHGNTATFGVPTMDIEYPGQKNLNDHEGGALAEFERVKQRGMGVIAATVYNSGLMINGATENAICNYRAATPREIERVSAIQTVCAEHEVPLPAAALQFPLAHPVVTSMVVGFSKPEEAEKALDWLDHSIPAAFWKDLQTKGLIDPNAPIPN